MITPLWIWASDPDDRDFVHLIRTADGKSLLTLTRVEYEGIPMEARRTIAEAPQTATLLLRLLSWKALACSLDPRLESSFADSEAWVEAAQWMNGPLAATLLEETEKRQA